MRDGYDAGILVTSLESGGLDSETKRLKERRIAFRGDVPDNRIGRGAVFDDSCRNLVGLTQRLASQDPVRSPER
jgi:hypothetical protein